MIDKQKFIDGVIEKLVREISINWSVMISLEQGLHSILNYQHNRLEDIEIIKMSKDADKIIIQWNNVTNVYKNCGVNTWLYVGQI